MNGHRSLIQQRRCLSLLLTGAAVEAGAGLHEEQHGGCQPNCQPRCNVAHVMPARGREGQGGLVSGPAQVALSMQGRAGGAGRQGRAQVTLQPPAHLSATYRCTATASAASRGSSASSSWPGLAPLPSLLPLPGARSTRSLPTAQRARKPRPAPHQEAWPLGKLRRPLLSSCASTPSSQSGSPADAWPPAKRGTPEGQHRCTKSGRGRAACGVRQEVEGLGAGRAGAEQPVGQAQWSTAAHLRLDQVGCQAREHHGKEQAQAHGVRLCPRRRARRVRRRQDEQRQRGGQQGHAPVGHRLAQCRMTVVPPLAVAAAVHGMRAGLQAVGGRQREGQRCQESVLRQRGVREGPPGGVGGRLRTGRREDA